MKEKKSFILYCDLIKTVEKLPNDKAGELFKIILNYVNDNDPIVEDILLDVAFEPIKQQLKRDLNRWDEIRSKRSEAGKKSAKVRAKQKATNSTSVKSVKQKATNSTVTVNDNVTVNVNEIKVNKGTPLNLLEVIDYFIEQRILHPEDNADKFYNFYEAKGWMIGKNKVKDWKACVKTWKLPKQKATNKEVAQMTSEEQIQHFYDAMKRGENG